MAYNIFFIVRIIGDHVCIKGMDVSFMFVQLLLNDRNNGSLL